MLKLLHQLEEHSGRLEKEAILKNNDSPELKMFLRYALDPFRQYYMKKVPKAPPAAKSRAKLEHMFLQLDRLRDRKVTGNDAIDEVTQFLKQLDASDQEVFKRILKKDLRCGVSSGIVNNVFKDLIPKYKMTGAKGYDESKLTFPRIAEPKFDGMRLNMIINSDVDDCEVVSGRSGKPVNTFDKFIPAALEIWPEGNVILDGEAMGVEVTFQGGMSAIKRKEDDGRPKKFVIFDVLTKKEYEEQVCKIPFTERMKRRRPIPKHLRHMFEYPESWEVKSIEEVKELFKKVRQIDPKTKRPKYEGLILKNPKGGYHFKKHWDWMKVKPLETVDLEITGVREGTGKYVGMLGALEMKYKGQDVRAGTGFSDEQRAEFWKHRKKLVGEMAEFEFMEETDDGKTRHAVFVRMRSYKGEKA